MDEERRDQVLAGIARAILRFDTLETRKSDDLDFHDVAVWRIREALEAAYQAGFEAAGRGGKESQTRERQEPD